MSKLPPATPPGQGASGDWLAVAHIARPHGVQGEVSAIPLTPPVLDPEEILLDRQTKLRATHGKLTPCRVEWVRAHQDRWLIKFERVDDMNAADALRGQDVCLARSDLPELPPDWYYEADLQGCRVVDERLGEIGVVVALELGYAQPQLKIRSAATGRDVLVPWRGALFPEVSLEAKLIRSRLPEGMPGIEDDRTEQA